MARENIQTNALGALHLKNKSTIGSGKAYDKGATDGKWATLIQAIVRAKIFAYRFVQERKIEVKAEEMAREMDRHIQKSEELRFLRLYKQSS